MRNYDLVKTAKNGGPEHGLISPAWYQTPVDRQMMKKLLLRRDARPLCDMLLYYLVMAFCAGAAIMFMPSWGSIPFWAMYGVLYASGRMPDGMNAAMAQPLKHHISINFSISWLVL